MVTTDSPSKILQAWIVAAGLGVSPPNPANPAIDWQTTYSRLPEDLPDNRIVTTGAGFVRDGRIFKTGEAVVHPLVQIRLRCAGTDFDAAWAKGKAIHTALGLIENTVVVVGLNSYTIKNATVTIPLTEMAQEEQNKRFHFAMTVQLTF